MSRQELVVNIKCDLTSDEESSYFGEIKKEYSTFFCIECALDANLLTILFTFTVYLK